jgi:hypothetical protein
VLKVFPIQQKSEQEALCARCGIPFEAELLAYQATVDEVFVGVCQFKLTPNGGVIYHLAPTTDRPIDNEAMFVMGRAALNFIDLCGIHRAFYDGDESIPGAQLLHAVGFRKNSEGRLEMDLTDFFSAPCQHHHD